MVLVPLTATPLVAQNGAAPVLNADAAEQVATAGYYTLSWTAPPDAAPDALTFELVEATDAAFTDTHLRYRGPDLATTISGKPEGTYYYRVRLAGADTAQARPWSNVHRVVVAHHPLRRAFAFLILGAVVFAATLGMILYGHTHERRAILGHTS